jgi:hypothetical protein
MPARRHYFIAMPRCLLLALILAAVCPLAANPPAEDEELAHTEALLRTLGELKAQVVEMQARIDELTRQLSERKGALANRQAAPPPFGGVLGNQSNAPDRPDARPALRRCAALTREGERCSRSALPDSRYCKQHALAKMK